MQSSKLKRWIEAGYPHLKAATGLPEWFVPQSSFSRLVAELGEDLLASFMGQPCLLEGLEGVVGRSPDPEMVPEEAWKAALFMWPPLQQVGPVAEACLKASGELNRYFMKGYHGSRSFLTEPGEVCTALMVIAFAPFHAQGGPLLDQLAPILGGDPDRPADLMKRFVAAVVGGDIITMERVRGCIAQSWRWLDWARGLVEAAQRLPIMPRPIAVTPAPSPELIEALARMIKETQDVDCGRDHREDPA